MIKWRRCESPPTSAAQVFRSANRCGVNSWAVLVVAPARAGRAQVEIVPRIDAQEIAGSEDGIEDSGAPASCRMSHEQEIFLPNCAWTNRSFYGIGIYLDVAKLRPSKGGQALPPVDDVVHGIVKGAPGKDRGIGGRAVEFSAQAGQPRERALGAAVARMAGSAPRNSASTA